MVGPPNNVDDTNEPKADVALNPWHPMTDAVAVKHLGKLGEEVSELGAAIFRCLIQGVDEVHPVTKKPNRKWLEDEIADVLAGIDLCFEHFNLDKERIHARSEAKAVRLQEWHRMA